MDETGTLTVGQPSVTDVVATTDGVGRLAEEELLRHPFEFLPNILRSLHPVLAAFAISFSSVTVVTNSLRLRSARLPLVGAPRPSAG